MKTTVKTFLILLLLVLSSAVKSQNVVAVAEYMKVPRGGDDEYMKLEDAWNKVHQARVDQGLILNWQLYHKRFSTSSDEYQYIVVTIYENMKKVDNSIPWDWIQKNYTEAERDAMMKRTEKARTMVKTEVYENLASASGDKPSKFSIISKWKAKPGMYSKYTSFEKEGAKPVFEEIIDNGGPVTEWSVWTKEFGEGDWDAVSVNSYENFGEWEDLWSALEPILRKMVTGDTTWEDVTSTPGKVRERVGSPEVWEMVGFVGPKED